MKHFSVPDGVWLGIGFAVAAALRLASLGNADLWTDEIQTLRAIRLPWGELVRERLHAGHSPLYFLAEKAWCSLAGESQFALRLPSAIAGVALLVPAWSLFRRLGGEKAAFWGTALLAVHPLFVELAREARMYPLLALTALIVADGAAAALDGHRPRAPFWIAAAIGPLIHPTWAIAMLPLAAWLFFECRDAPGEERRAPRAALAGIAASLVLLGVALLLASPQHQELTRRPWPREFGVFVLRIFAGSDLTLFRAVESAAALVILWLVVLAFGLRLATPRERRFALWIGAGVPSISVVVGAMGALPWGPARYIQVAVVGVVVLAVGSRRRGPTIDLAALVVVLGSICIGHIAMAPTAWSDAAATLRDDPSPVVVDDESSRIVLSHYLGRDVTVGSPPPGAAAWLRARLDVSGGERRVTLTFEPRR